MSDPHLTLTRRWATHLSSTFCDQLATAMLSGTPAIKALGQEVVGVQTTAAVKAALQLTATGDGPYVAGLLRGRLEATSRQPTVTPVWTGPEPTNHQHRLTVAVVADLVAEAREEIVLASYATYPSDDVIVALDRAVRERDVRLTLLLERPQDNPHFTGPSDPLAGVSAARLCWPASSRPSGASMHAKVLVIDRRTALVGSANLTGTAFTKNLECGLLVRGGTLPGELAEHLLSAGGLTTF